MKDERPNPDDLLASIQKEELEKGRGKLKIFLGMCPGVGKTYAMLQAARQRSAEGIDVLVAVVETHGRKDTEALLEGLTIASKIKRPYRHTVLEEMDLDTVLMIRPQLAIVDELAHTNAPGSRHPKRYQDVLEILSAGIDVYTTLNVQHIDSRAEAVRQISGVQVQETVPDSIFDEASEITLIDLSPEQLRERLKQGKVYMGERAATAAENFFREENLTALREMSLRVTAERVNHDLREIMTEQRISGPWKSSERLMVAVGPTPFSESLIRWTRQAATSLQVPWTAVYVQTPKPLSEADEKRLSDNLSLARQLGAEVVVKPATNVADTLLEVARQNNVTQICLGKPRKIPVWQRLWKRSPMDRLIEKSGDIDLHFVRLKSLGSAKKMSPAEWGGGASGREWAAAFILAVSVTGAGFLMEPLFGYASVSLLYLLTVVVAGGFISRLPVLLLAGLSAILWNYVFIPPKFTFLISKPYDVIMFVLYFVVALVMGQLTARLRERERAGRLQEEKVYTLYKLTKAVASSRDPEEALRSAVLELEGILDAEAAVLLTEKSGRLDYEKPVGKIQELSPKERSVANWAREKKLPAGRFTETLPESGSYYLPLVSLGETIGVLMLKPSQKSPWGLDQRTLIESFAALVTSLLERERLSAVSRESRLREESEKLQAALLDSVSHELKTPLTVIAGAAEHLEKKTPSDLSPAVSEIKMASRRLLGIVNNLLDMTRLNSGHFKIHSEWQDIRDVLNGACEGASDALKNHKIRVCLEPSFPLVKLDALLIQQVLQNLLTNAAHHSPQGGEIFLEALIEGSELIIEVRDQGTGMKEDELERVFEKFYRGPHERPGGLGLGLYIARNFIEAHGGTLEARNIAGGGACFTVRLTPEFFKSEGTLP